MERGAEVSGSATGSLRSVASGARAVKLARSTTLAAAVACCVLFALVQVAAAAVDGGPGPTPQGADPGDDPGDVAPVEIDAGRSTIVAVTGKAGLLRFLGHDHAILVTSWRADARYDPDRPEATSIEVVIDAAALEIDSPAALEAADLDSGPSDGDVREIAAKMRGPRFLAVEEHPEIRFRTSSVRVDAPGGEDGPRQLEVSGVLTIRDRSRRVTAPLRVEPTDDGWRVRGTMEIELRHFGIEPESIAGVVKVANEVDIRLDVHARPLSPGSPATLPYKR